MHRRRFLQASLGLGAFCLARPATAQNTPLVIGQSLDLSGAGQALGRDYFTGAKLCFDRANREGGVSGRSLRLLQLDDGGSPARAVANTTKLLQDERAELLFGYTNDACISASVGSTAFRSAQRLMFAPMSGGVAAAEDAGVIYLRATYSDEIAALLGTFHGAGLRRFALAHDASETAAAARKAALAILRTRGYPEPGVVAIGQGSNAADAAAAALIKAQPQVVVIFADTAPAALLTRALRQQAAGIFVCTTSNVDHGSLREIVGAQLATGVVVSRVVPDPLRDITPVVREFKRAFDQAFEETPSAATLEGYLAARALLQGLRRSSGSSDAARLGAALKALSARELGDFNNARLSGSRGMRFVDTAVITRQGAVSG